MLEFQIPKIEDRDMAKPILAGAEGMGNEFAFGTLFSGQRPIIAGSAGTGSLYLYAIITVQGRICIPTLSEREIFGRLWRCFAATLQKEGFPSGCGGFSREDCEELEDELPGRFSYEPFRNDFDYIYRSQDLDSACRAEVSWQAEPSFSVQQELFLEL